MNMRDAIVTCFSKYADFSGRARRSEYWFWVLFNLIVGFVANMISSLLGSLTLYLIVIVALLIPSISVTVRRLHDIGKSGWYYLLPAVPFVAMFFLLFTYFVTYDASNSIFYIIGLFEIAALVLTIIFIIWMAKDSQPGMNKYGPNPKENNFDGMYGGMY
jgi:uncharacterized membrane protein YhaH (DUF805 family)